ncbi:MAG: biotin--[acetyl-CoA-carboxylase] ligase [Clostridia bacterium]
MASIVHLDQTTSTMDEARKLSATQAYGAVMAESQTAGRGRIPGRSWDTRPGQALLATIWFPRTALQNPATPRTMAGDDTTAQPEPPVSLMAGLAVAKACLFWASSSDRLFRNGLAIKWPNDVLCGSNKLAGILCEATSSTIMAGIGINCSQSSFTGTYRTRPTSILMETGQAPDRHLLLTLILDELWTLIARRTGWREELDHLLAWKGKTVDFRSGLAERHPIRGVLAGIADDGAIILDIKGSRQWFHSGELSPVIDEYR